jgi:hypothetical protein
MAAGVDGVSQGALGLAARAATARHLAALRATPRVAGAAITTGNTSKPGASALTTSPDSPAAQQQPQAPYSYASFDLRTGYESFTIQFTEDFSYALSSDDLFVANTDNGAPLPFVLLDYVHSTNIATFVPATAEPVPDGWYTATLRASGVTDGAGQTMEQRGFGDAVFTDFALAGDANRDHTVGAGDLNVIASHFGLTGQTPETGDFTHDGLVGPADFNILATHFGKQLSPTPPAPSAAEPMRIDAGSAVPYVDAINRPFDDGSGFVGGADRLAAYDVGGPGFTDDALLLTSRAGNDFTFARPTANGHYALFLEFAEHDPSALPGQRKFDVSAEGQLLLDDYDITADAGSAQNPTVKQFNVTVTDGRLDLSFHGVVGEAVIGAIDLIPTDVPAAVVPYIDASASTDPTQQFAAEQRWLVQSDNNLRQVGIGISQYMSEHKGNYPPDLKTLFTGVQYVDHLSVLANPRVPSAVPRGEVSGLELTAWVSQQDGYIYVGAGLRSATTSSTTIVAFDNPSRVASDTLSVLYADAHVGRLPRAEIVAQFGGSPTPPPPAPRPLDVPASPTLSPSKQHLADIASALQSYNSANRGRYPNDLGSLVGYVNPAAFVNPRGNTPAPPANMTPEQTAGWLNAQTDYVYTGSNRRLLQPLGQTPLLYENPAKFGAADGIWVLFYDLHWEFRDIRWARETIARPRSFADPVTTPALGLVYSDDFTAADGTNLTALPSAWTKAGGYPANIAIAGNAAVPEVNSLYLSPGGTSVDWMVEASITPLTNTISQNILVCGRVDAATGDRYTGGFNIADSSAVIFYNGTPLAQVPFTTTVGTTYSVQLVLDSKNAAQKQRLYINGTLICSANDSTRTAAGYAGIRAAANGGSAYRIDNYRAYSFQSTLAAPTLSLSERTATSITLARTSAAGGIGDYTYSLYRSTTPGFSPSADTLIGRFATTTYTDVGRTPGVLYFYKVVVSDDLATATSAQFISAVDAPTVPIASVPSAIVPTTLAYIGSSTWEAGIPSLIASDFKATYPTANVTTVNAAVGGTTSANFLPGQPFYETLKAKLIAAPGYKILRMMIGSNDVYFGFSTATTLANWQAVVNDISPYVDVIILEEIGIRLDVGDPGLAQLIAINAGRSTITGSKVRLGSAYTLANTASDLSTLSPDNIHQTSTGAARMAQEQARELELLSP